MRVCVCGCVWGCVCEWVGRCVSIHIYILVSISFFLTAPRFPFGEKNHWAVIHPINPEIHLQGSWEDQILPCPHPTQSSQPRSRSQSAKEWRVNQAAAHHLHPHNPTPGLLKLEKQRTQQWFWSQEALRSAQPVSKSCSPIPHQFWAPPLCFNKYSLVSLGQGQFLLAAAKVLSLPQNILPPHDLISLFLVNNFCLKPNWMKKIYVKSCFKVSWDINTVFCWL